MNEQGTGDALVSFLGRSGRGYSPATYRFQNGREESARFFGCAAVKAIRTNDRTIRRWVVLGTAGSDWATIAEGAESGGPEVEDAVLEALERLEIPSRENRVTDAMLSPLESLISSALEIPEVRLRVVPYARNDDETRALARIIDEAVAGVRTIHLDVTHGMRHLPVIAMVTTFGLLWSSDMRLGHLFYGAHELRRDDVTPVLDLAACGEMSADTARIAAHLTTGRYDMLADSLPEGIGAKVREAAFLESVNRTGEARRPAASAIDAVAELDAESPIRSALLDAVSDSMTWSQGEKFLDRLRHRATQALERRDWMSASSLTLEAMLLASAGLAGVNPDPLNWNEEDRDRTFEWIKDNMGKDQKDVFHQSRILRNAIVHGTRPSGHGSSPVMEALKSPDAIERLLQRGLELLGQLIRQRDA